MSSVVAEYLTRFVEPLVTPLLLLAAALVGPAEDPPVRGDDDLREAKAVVTDQNGLPLPASAPFGRMLVFDGRKSVHGLRPKSVKWTVRPAELDVRKWQPVANAFAITPEPLDELGTPYDLTVSLSVALGDTVDELEITIRCGHGAIPPPETDADHDGVPDSRDKCPNTPVGTKVTADGCPEKEPPPPTAKHLQVIVVLGSADISADTAIIKNAVSYWRGLEAAGHKWRFYDKDDETALYASKYGIELSGTAKPLILIRNLDTDKKIHVAKLPKSLTEIDQLIRKYMSEK